MTDRNPYVDDVGSKMMRRSIVAFVDILGYTKEIEIAAAEGTSQQLLERICSALDEAQARLRNDPKDIEDIIPKNLYWLNSFTDNLVMGFPITSDDAESELGAVLIHLAWFQMIMSIKGFFIRGGLSVDEVYLDDDIVLGPGLIEAYKGESRLAREPRIVLAKSVVNEIRTHLGYYGKVEFAPHNREIYVDADGVLFLNYLDTIYDTDTGEPIIELLKAHKDAVEEKLQKHIADPVIWSKYSWVANYHNYYCEQNNFDDEHFRVDLASYRMQQCKLSDIVGNK